MAALALLAAWNAYRNAEARPALAAMGIGSAANPKDDFMKNGRT
jgi:hypothetical protein